MLNQKVVSKGLISVEMLALANVDTSRNQLYLLHSKVEGSSKYICQTHLSISKAQLEA